MQEQEPVITSDREKVYTFTIPILFEKQDSLLSKIFGAGRTLPSAPFCGGKQTTEGKNPESLVFTGFLKIICKALGFTLLSSLGLYMSFTSGKEYVNHIALHVLYLM